MSAKDLTRRRKRALISLAVQAAHKRKEEEKCWSGEDDVSSTSGCVLGSSDDVLEASSSTSAISLEKGTSAAIENNNTELDITLHRSILSPRPGLHKSQSVTDISHRSSDQQFNSSYPPSSVNGDADVHSLDDALDDDVEHADLPLHNQSVDDSVIGDQRRLSLQSRNLLTGPGGGVLIGMDELQAVLPNHTADIMVATWNMNGRASVTADSLKQILVHDRNVDVYAFGIQESPPPGSGFRQTFVVMMQKVIGQSFLKLKAVHMGTQLLVIFIRKSLIWFCSEPNHNAFRMKRSNLLFGAYSRTKGAVAIVFNLFKTTLLFISCHLSCTTVTARVEDYWNILKSLRFPNYGIPKEYDNDPIAYFDKVFWFGDLNFRIDETRSTLELMLDQMLVGKELVDQAILNTDQLTQAMNAGAIFHNFQESRISFPPTYKYDVGSQILDTSSKQRPPAYTDRILFRDKSSLPQELLCMLYHSSHGVCLSDHKPVFAQFKVKINPGRNFNVSSSVSAFSTDIKKIHSQAFNSKAGTHRNEKSRLCVIS